MSSLHISQDQKYEGDDWWSWSVWVEGSKEELDQIDYVEYTLHPTFPKPVQRIGDRNSNFKLTTGGWGTFVVHAKAYPKNGAPVSMRHELELYYPDGKPTLA